MPVAAESTCSQCLPTDAASFNGTMEAAKLTCAGLQAEASCLAAWRAGRCGYQQSSWEQYTKIAAYIVELCLGCRCGRHLA